MDKYILASQSPRRRELLHMVIHEYEVIPARGEEVVCSTDPAEVVQELSMQKASEVAGRVRPCAGDRMIVIGADTVVAVDREILGKPADREEARRMIRLLQGREHHVYTGVSVCWTEGGRMDSFSFCEETAVDVFPMNRGEIEGYISLQEPYDKAGAYGIQGFGCRLVKRIEGDYFTVMGLPVAEVARRIEKIRKDAE